MIPDQVDNDEFFDSIENAPAAEYQIVKCDMLQDLVTAVNKHMAKGWRPLGGVTFYPVYADNSGKAWVQAMIRGV